MIATNYTEFRVGLKGFLDRVEDDQETLIIKRGAGKGAVLISLQEYNSMMETMHIMSSKANVDNLLKSIKEMNEGRVVVNPNIDL